MYIFSGGVDQNYSVTPCSYKYSGDMDNRIDSILDTQSPQSTTLCWVHNNKWLLLSGWFNHHN